MTHGGGLHITHFQRPARTVAPTLNLADPAQAAARQDSAAPLLARLAADLGFARIITPG